MSRVVALPLAPVLVRQARALRRNTPRLPDAAGRPTGSVEGPHPMSLLVVGDSTAVGVGADHHDRALAGSLAKGIRARSGRGVTWTIVGESGATSRDLLERYLDQATAASHDLVFVSVGANDAIKVRKREAYMRDLSALLTALRSANPDAPFIVSCFPVFGRFPNMPDPLRSTLYLHSRSLEDAGRAVVAAMPGMIMSPPPPPYTPGFFGADGFHPSEQGYREWAEFALDDAAAQGLRV
jgi:lysophospholipase L1-like esterase